MLCAMNYIRLVLIAFGVIYMATPELSRSALAETIPLSSTDLAPSGYLQSPALTAPPDGQQLVGVGPVQLAWDLPPGATQYHLEVSPINDDGPGINLIRNAE